MTIYSAELRHAVQVFPRRLAGAATMSPQPPIPTSERSICWCGTRKFRPISG